MLRPDSRPSIARRITRTMLLVSSVGVLAMAAFVTYIGEDLEDSILELELQHEREFILAHHDLTTPLAWSSADLLVRYVPAGAAQDRADLPTLFRDIPVNTSAEVETEGQTWLLLASQSDRGQLYLAKNISHFEAREDLFERILVLVAVIILGMTVLAAAWSSRRMIQRLQHLAHTIAQTPAGASMAPIVMAEPCDAELYAIAASFNRFTLAQRAYVERERALLRMAGHELRTPIAVLSGALDVLQARGAGTPETRVTLDRAQRACNHMRENVNTLLTLARADASVPRARASALDVTAVLDEIARDLATQRLALDAPNPQAVNADPALVRMLLHNLIQNALQHTRGAVRVEVTQDTITVADQGAGLPAQAHAMLRGAATREPGALAGGLGLYIVTLIAERLGWPLEIASTPNGTRIQIHTHAASA